MTDFILTTNESSSTTYDGPSGIRYVIFRKNPFTVGNPQDVEYFRNNPRFEEVSIIEKILPPEPEKSKEDLFTEEIESLKISKYAKTEITKAYLNKKDFIEDLEEDYKLGPKVSKKEMQIIKSHFLNEDGDKSSPTEKKPKKKGFDSIAKIKKRMKR